MFAAFVVFDDEAVDDAFDEVNGDCDCLLVSMTMIKTLPMWMNSALEFI